MQIWKYSLSFERQEFLMPVGARIISAKVQGTGICLWAVVNPECLPAYYVTKTIMSVMTGQECEIPDEWVFIETVMLNSIVIHIFEEK